MSPPTRVTQVSPVFPVASLRRALAHYASLGFATVAYEGGDGYGFAERDGVGLHLSVATGSVRAGTSAAYLYVDDADTLYAEWTRPGIEGVTRPVTDTPYRLREGSHTDPDGNLLRFGSPLAAAPRPEDGHGELGEELVDHLTSRYGVVVTGLSELDAGVFRVDRGDGPSWVARCFSPSRPPAAAGGDAEILRYLAEQDFPAERCADPDPVSMLDGRSVLVTEFVHSVPRVQRRAAIGAMGGIRRLGELMGRLHTLPTGAGGDGGALSRPGGAWHHLADGRPSEEISAAARRLAAAEHLVAHGDRSMFESLQNRVSHLDGGDGLPEALVHPDFVLANVVPSPQRGLVVVDWTGTGRAARLWPLAFLLFVEGAKGLGRVDLVVAGYRRHVDLEPEELARLDAVMRARPLIFEIWALCSGHKSLADATRDVEAADDVARRVGARARAAFGARRPV